MTTFTNKETYLAYRSEWKANYKTLSHKIQRLKNEIKETQRANGYAGSMQYNLLRQRAFATTMIEGRKESKVEAQRQYVNSKERELVMA